MKALKKIGLTALLLAAFVGTNAQNRRSSSTANPQRTDGRTQQPRSTSVDNQPKPYNVDREQVTYKRNEPKVVVVRDDNNRDMRKIVHQNNEYYTNAGFYYKRVNHNYVRTAPPIGLHITILPVGYIIVTINSGTYFYYEGTYYISSGNEYAVVNPPIGAIVYAIPVDYEKVIVDGKTYYEYNGILYSKIYYNGERAYQVIGYVN
ncbi:DUF6515 family protein [Flavobacterium sp. NRK F10]|uniref:Uncharacterized protein n=1 Tax=Flavobacterium sediminis TaxID=2201181 RepID=A0A2U8QY25_9FLAO|nr:MULTISPECIES: DUF6515 family protein [Flavobacterium]AWM14715.1 hypothetical protein DI487_13175 [Flavobacterium sediminis]MCO6175961.1 DUF6515 family protein [Flavobacterium sp. NRK F10]